MIDYTALLSRLDQHGLSSWSDSLPHLIEQYFSETAHGDMPGWLNSLKQLPVVQPSKIELNSSKVTVGSAGDCSQEQLQILESTLQSFHPWRKGPFELFGIYIDTEWRSDMKWDRVKDYIEPLNGRTVLDVGCGSGYHCWRMRGAGAELVVGIEPTLLYVMQFHAVQKYIQSPCVHVLPFSTDTMPPVSNAFDSLFSMGVLYHRRSPLDHLFDLKNWLKKDGELVLETLVIDETYGQLLVPESRYAKMRNVWFIPSCTVLEVWLRRCGFRNVRCVDVTRTTVEEQRQTGWMRFESLDNFLDSNDPEKTIEGLPAPRRAIFLANA